MAKLMFHILIFNGGLVMNKKYQVFVSSTYTDLKEERLAVISGLLENNCIPVGMEQFPASPLSQWEYIKMMIDDSDYYVLIVAGKYGSIDPETNISYTEKEFHYAQEKKIPVIPFLHKNIDNIVGAKLEKDTDKREMLIKFRSDIEKDRLVNYYQNVDDLKSKVITSIHSAIQNINRPGWIRANKSLNNEILISKEELYKLIDQRANQIIKDNTATDEEVEEALNKYFEDKTLILNGGNAKK